MSQAEAFANLLGDALMFLSREVLEVSGIRLFDKVPWERSDRGMLSEVFRTAFGRFRTAFGRFRTTFGRFRTFSDAFWTFFRRSRTA